MTDATKTAKNLAQQIATQALREPAEVLKEARGQVIGIEEGENQGVQPQEPQQPKEISSQEKAKIEAQGARQFQALENELKEIRALKEQGKAVAPQQEQKAKKPLVEPATKPSRRFSFFGKKTQAERLKTHVEKILPTSS